MVSQNDTTKSSFAKLLSGNIGWVAYALSMGFGERLREARKAAGLSGTDLGTKLATTKTTISHWELGHYEPNIAQIKALCAALKVSPDWLLEEDGLNLSAEAINEARAYEALGSAERRKWRALRLTMFADA